MNWFLLNIKSNEAQHVADIFHQMNIETFCPNIEAKQETVNTFKDYKEIMPNKSYLFVKLAKKYRGVIFGIPHVLGFFTTDGKPALATDEEIETIKQGKMNHFKTLKIIYPKKTITT